MTRFSKYHALGNAYIVIAADQKPANSLPALARHLCNYRVGIGSDGLLYGPLPSNQAGFRLRIFNPDGSEAEKSGNGLRIFCQYLYDNGLVSVSPFVIETKGGVVNAQALPESGEVRVSMGQVSFNSKLIPVTGADRDVLCEELEVAGRKFTVSCATIGNPHCIVFIDEPTEAMARHFGPLFEVHPNFPNRSNVQFVRVIDKSHIQMEIWERGAGYTHASGSSSCAAAAVAFKLGLVNSTLTVHMRGGDINIDIADDYELTMTGPVRRICVGNVLAENM